mmetsp:Transcript_3538/g.5813  ORF Transcript_3538/g.5813 Transcript_3538/m.5813 type:complete len:255 (+) Transcript_3538:265-1029(+)
MMRASLGRTSSGPTDRIVEHPQLSQLSAMLKAIDAGDRIIKGRLELFRCSSRALKRCQLEEIHRRCPETFADSPLGPLASDTAQNLLANLMSLMALLFVDYDCGSLTPLDFERCPDKHAVVNTINHSLASVVDRIHSGFLSEFWKHVQEAIDLAGCEVYALRPMSGTFEPADNSLMSFHYFFVDANRGYILFIGSITKNRASARGSADSESEVTISQDTASNSSKGGGGSSMGSSLQEGEYCFSEDSGSDRMLD